MSRVVDLSFRSCESTQELVTKVKHTPKKTLSCGCLKINNNKLSDLSGIAEVVRASLGPNPNFAWLDASFNELTAISAEVIPDILHIQALYLHGNKLKDLQGTLEQLRKLPDLKSVTLNGNPIETTPGYRLVVLGALPNLRSIDHAAVTLEERERARMWFQNTKHTHKH